MSSLKNYINLSFALIFPSDVHPQPLSHLRPYLIPAAPRHRSHHIADTGIRAAPPRSRVQRCSRRPPKSRAASPKSALSISSRDILTSALSFSVLFLSCVRCVRTDFVLLEF
ncbi:hypothetical protein ACS0TY_015940 [Phlomoides rotata]